MAESPPAPSAPRLWGAALLGSLLLGLLYGFLFGLYEIPGLRLGVRRMSPLGPLDLLYLGAVTVLGGVVVALWRQRASLAARCSGGGGMAMGLLGAACPVCQGLVFTGGGLSLFALPLGALAPYSDVAKAASLGLLGAGVWRMAPPGLFHSLGGRSPPERMRALLWGLTAMAAGLLLLNQMLIFSLSADLAAPEPSSVASLSGPTGGEETQAASGLQRPYGWNGAVLRLDDGPSYDALVAMERAVSLERLSAEQQAAFRRMTGRYPNGTWVVPHPCCQGTIDGCNCKHAVAERGLMKYLLSQGWSEGKVLEEVLLWNRFFFPAYYAQGGDAQRGGC